MYRIPDPECGGTIYYMDRTTKPREGDDFVATMLASARLVNKDGSPGRKVNFGDVVACGTCGRGWIGPELLHPSHWIEVADAG